MLELLFKAKMESNNKIIFYSDEFVLKNTASLIGKDIFVSIKEFKPKRSIKQNNWYYGVAIPIIQAFILDTQGEKYTKEEINQYHLNNVIKPELETKAIFNKVCIIYNIKSTSKMSTVEFMEFKESIQDFWAQYEVIIPDPDIDYNKTKK